MAFTYVGDLATDRDRVRFYLQDTVEDSGPRPSGANFTDAEVDGLVSVEGSWQGAVGAGLEALAVAWANYVDLLVGPRRESLSQVSERYAEQAEEWRKRYGVAAPVMVAGVIRVDGYSDDVTSDDVDTSSEYGLDFEYVRPA